MLGEGAECSSSGGLTRVFKALLELSASKFLRILKTRPPVLPLSPPKGAWPGLTGSIYFHLSHGHGRTACLYTGLDSRKCPRTVAALHVGPGSRWAEWLVSLSNTWLTALLMLRCVCMCPGQGPIPLGRRPLCTLDQSGATGSQRAWPQRHTRPSLALQRVGLQSLHAGRLTWLHRSDATKIKKSKQFCAPAFLQLERDAAIISGLFLSKSTTKHQRPPSFAGKADLQLPLSPVPPEVNRH